MNQNLHSCSPDWMEGAEHIQGIGGTESEDGLAFIQHDEGLWTESGFRSGRPMPASWKKAFGGQLLVQSPRNLAKGCGGRKGSGDGSSQHTGKVGGPSLCCP